MPPESSDGNLSWAASRLTVSSVRITIFSISASDMVVCSRSGSATLSATLMLSNSAAN